MEGLITIQDAVISFIEKIKGAKKLHKLIAYFAVAVILIAASIYFSGVRITYNIKYNDAVLANVTSKSIYEQGMKKATAAMSGKNTEIAAAEIVPVITVNADNASADELSQLILKNSPSVCYGYEVTAEGQSIAFISDVKAFEDVAAVRLSSFDVAGAQCESSFTKEINITPAYFHTEKLTNKNEIKKIVDTLEVKTVATTKKVYTVKYDTITKKDASKNAGYQRVLTKGVNGSSQTVKEVTYLNGVAATEPVISDVVLEYPIDQVLLIGTKNVYIYSAPQNASASGFCWPLSEKGVITSYWGDGRGHKGVDIGVASGTSILAVKAGKVVEQGYRSDYGYYVTIDHGNGVKTRYAHNKSNVVEVGQNVSAGQVIALSGNTGRSTGPHLHFEVIINGTRVNPAYYLNLR